MSRSVPWALAACAALGTLLATVAVVVDGPGAALSVWLGVVVVAGFFSSGAVPLAVVRGQEEARAGAGAMILLLTYTLRLVVAVAVLRVAGRSDAVDPAWTGGAVIGCALAWVVAQAVAALRVRDPDHILTPVPSAPRDDLPGHGPDEEDR